MPTIKTDISKIKFDDKGLVPAVAQDSKTGEVLMVAYMNKESLEKTLASKKAWYFSRSRQELWLKGGTSGNIQTVEKIYYDCDGDTILLRINQTGVACHTGAKTCFFTNLETGLEENQSPYTDPIMAELFSILKNRKNSDPKSSYVASLYKEGTPKILEKIKEESGELVEAATIKDDKEVVLETADLLFHMMVLLAEKNIEMYEVYEELKRRFGTSGIDEKNSRNK